MARIKNGPGDSEKTPEQPKKRPRKSVLDPEIIKIAEDIADIIAPAYKVRGIQAVRGAVIFAANMISAVQAGQADAEQ